MTERKPRDDGSPLVGARQSVLSSLVDRASDRPMKSMTEINDRLLLPPEPASAGAARRFVAAALEHYDVDIDVIALLVSELVSNVVLHAHTPFEVTLRVRDEHIRVSVADESPLIPAMKQYAADSVTGRGLTMIDSAAARWGIDETAGGKAVWFEMPCAEAVAG